MYVSAMPPTGSVSSFCRFANRGDLIRVIYWNLLYVLCVLRRVSYSQTAQGSTALMLACKRGHEEVVRVLLTAGAELHQKDSRGRTARDTASKRSHETILAMLHPSKQMRLMQVGNRGMTSQKFSNPWYIYQSCPRSIRLD